MDEVVIEARQIFSNSSGFLDGYLVGIHTDANWTVRDMTFQAKYHQEFYDVYDEGVEYKITNVQPVSFVRVDEKVMRAARELRIRSGTKANPRTQPKRTAIMLLFWKDR